MAEKVMEAEARGHEEERARVERGVTETVRSVLLAGIGALALTKDEIEEILNRLVERGELAEKDARRLFEELKGRPKKEVEVWEERLSKALEPRLKRMLEQLNLPTRDDVQALSERIRTLEEKLEELRKES